MNADEVIEYACLDRYDWEFYPTKYASHLPQLSVPVDLSDVPLGQSVQKKGSSGSEYLFRRMPRDPLLRAMVIARLEAECPAK